MVALGKARGVYGIRKITLDEERKTMRVQFDDQAQSCGGGRTAVLPGIDIVEEIPLAAPMPPKEEPAAP